MRRQLQHINCEEYLTNLDTREPSVNAFNVENLQCKVSQPVAVRHSDCFSLRISMMQR